MTHPHYGALNAGKALIWRIVHRDNLPWILRHGIPCANGSLKAPDWVGIGNVELIDKRSRHPVPIPPGGALGDYVPFYFTPFSVMLLNILTGRSVRQRRREEIVILVSSIPHVQELGLRYVFTDAHAYYAWANFYSDPAQLDKIDWAILQARDFKRDPDDPEKIERYQAEALVHSHLPITALQGIVSYTEEVKSAIERELSALGLSVPVHARQGWYF
jgi:hypothetical protein